MNTGPNDRVEIIKTLPAETTLKDALDEVLDARHHGFYNAVLDIENYAVIQEG